LALPAGFEPVLQPRQQRKATRCAPWQYPDNETEQRGYQKRGRSRLGYTMTVSAASGRLEQRAAVSGRGKRVVITMALVAAIVVVVFVAIVLVVVLAISVASTATR
jgi:hypothetical protein